MIRLFFSGLLILAFLPSCNWFGQLSGKGEPIAKANGKTLYLDDIIGFLANAQSTEDSALIIKDEAERWILEQLLLKQAENNLSADKLNFEKKVTDYRNSLYIFAYEKAFVRQKLDTIVSDKEIETYYKNNSKDFELKDFVVKVQYVKVAQNAPKKNVIEQELFYKRNEKAILDYCIQFATNYSLDDDNWVYFDELLREIPINVFDVENFLRRNKQVKVEDDDYLYLLKIQDYRLKDAQSPLEFEKEKIRNIIINQRKMELIKKLRNDLMKDAFANSNAELFVP